MGNAKRKEISSNFILLVDVALSGQYKFLELCVEFKKLHLYFFHEDHIMTYRLYQYVLLTTSFSPQHPQPLVYWQAPEF